MREFIFDVSGLGIAIYLIICIHGYISRFYNFSNIIGSTAKERIDFTR